MNLPRRMMLRGMVASAALLSSSAFAASKRQRVGVIGGGIIGASIAYQLAKLGADVTVFERSRPAAEATRNSVAWINPVVDDAIYMKLRLDSMSAWLEDDRALGLNAIWGGSVSWAYADKAKALQAKGRLLEATDDPPRYLTGPEITTLCPGVFAGDGVQAAFVTKKDGHVDPVLVTERYLAEVRRLGGRVIFPCEVSALIIESGRANGVETSKGRFALDAVISATGVDTPRIMAMAGKQLTLAHKPGLVVHTTPQPVMTRRVFEASSIIEFKQYADGRFLTSFTGGPPNLPVHQDVLARQMQYPSPELRAFHGQMLIDRTAAYIPAIAKGKPAEVLVGFRPYPLDNRPICGAVPGVSGLYAVVTHSGITLAPILGRYTAQEVLTGKPVPALSPYRPDRYISA